jgi:hypothetical protein
MNLLNWGCFGSPEWTYCDVERAVQAAVRQHGFLQHYQALLARQTEAAELALLANLQSKYSAADGEVSCPELTAATPLVAPPVSLALAPTPQKAKPSEQLGLFAA